MIKCGIIGGVSWHSTMELYELVNEYVANEKGGLNCAELTIVNVNLNDIVSVNSRVEKAKVIQNAAMELEASGCDYIALCSNGLHQFADEISKVVDIPLLHIGIVTADKVKELGFTKVGLLGVRETMEDTFYKEKLQTRGIDVLIPNQEQRTRIDRILFEETGKGIVKESSSNFFYEVGNDFINAGVECIILGCTEIGMLMNQNDINIPLLDTTKIYAEKIGQLACEK